MMTQWYVKELSKITGISVQALHHYDRIDLLQPSVRMPNGYRLYSERDLLKLQQIIALKFFGFELAQIKALLSDNVDMIEHFKAQSQFLEKKAKSLLEVSKALKSVISGCYDDKSIPWENIIELIEVYNMTQKLDNEWVAEILTPEELKQYAKFEQGLKNRYSQEEEKKSEKGWADFIVEVEKNLNVDPTSAKGIDIGKRVMAWVNGLYGKENANLKLAIWEKGIGQGKGLQEMGLRSETVAWLDKAIDAYWRNRIYGILAKVGNTDLSIVRQLWDEVMEDMYGNMQPPKNAVIEVCMTDDRVSLAAREWLKTL